MKFFLVYWLTTSMVSFNSPSSDGSGENITVRTITLPGGVATGRLEFKTIEACRAARTDMQVQADEFGGPQLIALCVKA